MLLKEELTWLARFRPHKKTKHSEIWNAWHARIVRATGCCSWSSYSKIGNYREQIWCTAEGVGSFFVCYSSGCNWPSGLWRASVLDAGRIVSIHSSTGQYSCLTHVYPADYAFSVRYVCNNEQNAEHWYDLYSPKLVLDAFPVENTFLL